MNLLLPDGVRDYALLHSILGRHSVTDWVNPETGHTAGRRNFMLSLDFDPEKLPGNAPLWKSIKHTLSYTLPPPALELTPALHLLPGIDEQSGLGVEDIVGRNMVEYRSREP